MTLKTKRRVALHGGLTLAGLALAASALLAGHAWAQALPQALSLEAEIGGLGPVQQFFAMPGTGQ